jgi:2-oxoisovalerate dehydrogenase E1 component alpha subunit
VERLKTYLIKSKQWDEKRHKQLEQKIDDEVMSAYKEACEFGDLASGPYPPASTIFTEVYETVPWHVQEQREELGK